MIVGNKFPQFLIGSAVLFATVISIVSAVALRNGEIDRIYSEQEHTNSILNKLIVSKIEHSQDVDVRQYAEAARPFVRVRSDAREMSAKAASPQFAPISFLAFDYFAGRTDEFSSVFYSQRPFPEGEDCASMIGVPEQSLSKFRAFLASERIKYERYRCYTAGGQNFIGFLMDSASGRHITYLYLQRFPEGRKLSLKSLNTIIAENMNTILGDNGIEMHAAWYDGRLVASTPNFNEKESSLKPDPNQKIVNNEISVGDRHYLSTVSCKDRVCVLSAFPTNKLSSLFIFIAVFAFFAGAVIVAGILQLQKRHQHSIDEKNTLFLEKIKSIVSFISKHDFNKNVSLEPLQDHTISMGSDFNNAVVEVGHAFLDKLALLKTLDEEKIAKIKNHASEEIEKSLNEGKAQALKAVQSSLMPKEIDLPSSRFLDISSLLLSSKKACTDTYDLFRADKDNLVFSMLSCSHKGPDAMALLPEAIILLRKFIRDEGLTPDLAYKEINKLLMERNHTGATISAFTMILSEFTGNYSCTSAGFKAPLLSTMSGVTPLELSVSRSLSENPEEHFFLNKGKLDFGNSILIITPGCFSLKNAHGEEFGETRMTNSLAEKYERSSQEMIYNIMHKLHEFSPSEPDQDLCVLCVKKTNNAKNN